MTRPLATPDALESGMKAGLSSLTKLVRHGKRVVRTMGLYNIMTVRKKPWTPFKDTIVRESKMKLTKLQLRQIIKEELKKAAENPFGTGMEELDTDDPEVEEVIGHT